MRKNIVHPGAGNLTYEIRGIVAFARELKKMGQKIIWENIGDPIAKGEEIPDWLKEVIKKQMDKKESYAYCPTKGVLETRKYISKKRKEEGINLSPEDILFFNGLGDAISTTYFYINKHARVITPSPVYPAHSSAESSRTGSSLKITYSLLPEKKWQPDLNELENKIKYDSSIAGILLINPGNPVSVAYKKKSLQKIAEIAEKYKLFIIADEVYGSLAHQNNSFFSISSFLKNKIPALIMRGLSKEVPWPGARCGWVEFYNTKTDPNFAKFAESIMHAKMLEVCSTTLPQLVLPKIFEHPEYKKYLKERIKKYKRYAELAHKVFSKDKRIISVKPNAAFYFSIAFKPEYLKDKQKIKIKNPKIKKYLAEKLQKNNFPPDKRFCYYLMASSGICIVPLSGFDSHTFGFRFTLLEQDFEKFKKNVLTIKEKLDEYLSSC